MGINFQNVEFKYNKKNKKHQLQDVSLQINEKDEFVMIVGQTGSGKSTLVQHMNGLLFPTKGNVQVFETNIIRSKKIKLKPVRKHIGLVFQFPEYQIFESTVIEDIMFGPKNFGQSEKQARESAIFASKLIGIDESLYERSPFSLSGGQKRRVAIAGTLAIDPDILILDEPTVGLDPKGKTELMNMLVELQKQTHKSIIMISHDMDIVCEYAKRVIVMNKGKKVYDGDKQSLFEAEELLNNYNLDLPTSAILAKGLKEKGLINYQHLPLTKDELFKVIIGGDENE